MEEMTPKILVVDDIEENIYALCKMLAKLDAEIVTAKSGNEALFEASRHELALILLDVQMPDMDGYETAEILKSNESTANIPIIFVTAIDSSESKAVKGYTVGAVDFIFKPINDFILISKVKVFLELYRTKNHLEELVSERTYQLKQEIVKSRETEQRLRILNKQIEFILGATKTGMAVMSVDYSIRFMDDARIKQLGDFSGEKCYSLLMGRSAVCPGCPLQRAIETDKPAVTEMRISNESNRPAQITIIPFRDSDGELLVAEITVDISERKKVEEQLGQAQKMETVGTLASGLAHDFNNILGGIFGSLSILKFKVGKKKGNLDVEDVVPYLTTIEKSSERAADMVQQLLTLSHKRESSFAPVDLNMTIKHVMKIIESSFDKSINIKPEYAGECAVVNADPTQLEQVLLNLCVNAAHAMTIMRGEDETWGGDLAIVIQRKVIDKNYVLLHPKAREGEYWKLSVNDSGIGMDRETQLKIFDPFYTTKHNGKGTGLGLSMVYNIVDQHKGFLNVYSEKGMGSSFNIYLPLLDEDICEDSSGKQEIPKGEGTVLVIDDEEIMRNTAKILLEECGYKVYTAENGKAGVDIYREHRDEIKIVLLDMVMPIMSGKEAFIEMKKINVDVKALLVSGFSEDKRIQDILDCGVRYFVQKPYKIEELVESIEKYSK